MDLTIIDGLLAQAAGHLNAAADVADKRAGEDPFSAWSPFAGHIRLIAAGLSTSAEPVTANGSTADGITRHLKAAATALDTIPAGHGPADLPFWAWHLNDLQRQTHQLATAP